MSCESTRTQANTPAFGIQIDGKPKRPISGTEYPFCGCEIIDLDPDSGSGAFGGSHRVLAMNERLTTRKRMTRPRILRGILHDARA